MKTSLLLNEAPHQDDTGGNGAIASHIFNLGTQWKH